ncbi:MAG: tetraacyldisaccharide 4'-kinase [Desulfobulbaceae bacterium]|nr:tetraacyldisaccharide 4'-kinase [Desulfobulbaceae bacterium]
MKNRNILFLYGRPFAPLYSAAMRMREFFYRVGVLQVTNLDVPVISIGNLTLGGTGKTPVVRLLAGLLKDWGWSPAVISRGYGGVSKERVNIVSTGEQPLLEASFVGDEPRFLAESLEGVAILTGAVRKYPAQKAVALGSDVLILDDGFQHLALARTVDLVLFNADTLAGNSRVFPGGDLREPVKALQRCTGFIITGVNDRNRKRAESFAGLLSGRFPGRPVFLAQYRVKTIIKYEVDGKRSALSKENIKGISFYGFSGIAHPENFQQSMEDIGLNVKGFKSFSDHYHYRESDMRRLCRLGEEAGANALITTEKDMVKLHGLSRSMPLYTVGMEAVMDKDFHDYLQSILAVKSPSTR